MSRLTLSASALVFSLACNGASSDSFDWRVDLQLMPDAFLCVWSDPAGDEVIAVGGAPHEGLLLEWSAGATAWRAPLVPDGTGLLWWTWSEPGGRAFAVGEERTVLSREPGGPWLQAPLDDLADPSTIFYGVWGSSADDVWVVGGSSSSAQPPAILHWDGVIWTADDTSAFPLVNLFKVWGSSADDVWAVGEQGLILHRVGGEWHQVESGTVKRLITVIGRAADEVYAVGGSSGGIVLRWDGTAWSTFGETDEALSGVWTAPGRPLYVAGYRGFVGRYGASGDTGDPDPAAFVFRRPLLDVDFHSVTGSADRVVAAGADILGGTPGDRSGTLAVHGLATPGDVDVVPRPDAGPADAAIPDAVIFDGAVDAAPPDAHWPTEGEACAFYTNDAGINVPYCAGSLVCWELRTTGFYMCTQECVDATECSAYTSDAGVEPCCRRPGFQTLTTVCIPGTYAECSL